MVAAILIAGIWGIWKALVQRRYTETAGALAVSVLFVLIALFFVYQPRAHDRRGEPRGRTRSRSRSSPAPTAARSTIPSRPSTRSPTTCSRRSSTGRGSCSSSAGSRHCVDTDRLDDDGFPRPVGPHDPARDVCRDHLEPDATGTAATPPATCASRPGRRSARPSTTRCATARRPSDDQPVRRLPGRQGRRARGRHPAGRRRLPAPHVLGRRVPRRARRRRAARLALAGGDPRPGRRARAARLRAGRAGDRDLPAAPGTTSSAPG